MLAARPRSAASHPQPAGRLTFPPPHFCLKACLSFPAIPSTFVPASLSFLGPGGPLPASRPVKHVLTAATCLETGDAVRQAHACASGWLLQPRVGLQVLATRKGLRNQLKGLLWRGKSGSGPNLAATAEAPARPPSARGQAYGVASVEGQMRALADVAFMMQDYELAAATLKQLSSDLRADKAWKHYAGAQASLQPQGGWEGLSRSPCLHAAPQALPQQHQLRELPVLRLAHAPCA